HQVEEGQRQSPVRDGRADPLQRQPRPLAGVGQPHPPHVPQPERGPPASRPQDPQLDQPPHQLGGDPRPPGQLRPAEGDLLPRHPRPAPPDRSSLCWLAWWRTRPGGRPVEATVGEGERLDVRKTYKVYIGGRFPRTESGRSYLVSDS